MGIHAGPQVAYCVQVAKDGALTFPMLIDVDNTFLSQYGRVGTGAKLFPLSYLIDKAGGIATFYTEEEPAVAEVVAKVKELLGL